MSPTRKKPATRAAPRRSGTKKARRPGPARAARATRVARRADFGAPIDAFLARQPPHLAEVLLELRKMIEAAAPEATASIKWGMPFFAVGGEMMCALGAFRSHVNLVLPGPPGTYADPEGRLEGEARTGRHLKLRALDELPRAAVRGWLRTAAARGRGKAREA